MAEKELLEEVRRCAELGDIDFLKAEECLLEIPCASPHHAPALRSLARGLLKNNRKEDVRRLVRPYFLGKTSHASHDIDLLQQALPAFSDEEDLRNFRHIKSCFLTGVLSWPDNTGPQAEKKIEALIEARFYREAQNIIDNLSIAGTEIINKQQAFLRKTRARLGGFWEAVIAASDNEIKPQGEQSVLYRGELVPLAGLPETVPVIQLFFHTNFFRKQADGRDGSYERHNNFALALFSLLSKRNIACLPRHQFNSFGVSASPDFPALSHHTMGGHRTHWHFKESGYPGHFMLDPDGFSGWASLARDHAYLDGKINGTDPEAARDFVQALCEKTVALNISKYVQPARQKTGHGKKYVLCALQVQNDAVAQLAHVNGLDMTATVVDYYRGKDTTVVIKRHPLCKSRKTEEFLKKAAREPHVAISDSSIHDLISGASRVFTVNSGVGLESLLHRKTVICTGDAEYGWAAIPVTSKEELLLELEKDRRRDPRDIDRFLYFFFNVYLIPMNDRACINGNIDRMLEKMEIAVERKDDAACLSATRFMSPVDLFTPRRFDLVVKYLYAQRALEETLDERMRDLYRRHILYRRRGEEDSKTSVDDYFSAFDDLVASMKGRGFDPQYPVPVSDGVLKICNGAHRVAVAAALNTDIPVQEGAVSAAPHWGYDWFRDCHFPQQDLDLLVRTYISLKPERLAMFCFWGAVEEQWEALTERLSCHGEIVATRTMNMQAGKISEFVQDIYAYGRKPHSTQPGLDKCAALSTFPPRVRVVLVEFPKSVEDAGAHSKKVKESLRKSVADVSPPELFLSVHSSEREGELRHMGDIIFSTCNILHLRRRSNISASLNFSRLLESLVSTLEEHRIDPEDVCVAGSAPMEIFGLRQASDIDIIVRGRLRAQIMKNPETSEQIGPGVDIVRPGYHRMNRQGKLYGDDDIIDNPDLHFRYRGIKFASLEIVRDRKASSHRDKDLEATIILDGFLNDECGFSRGDISFNRHVMNVLSINRMNPVINRMIKEKNIKISSLESQLKGSLRVKIERNMVRLLGSPKKFSKYSESPQKYFEDARLPLLRKYGQLFYG